MVLASHLEILFRLWPHIFSTSGSTLIRNIKPPIPDRRGRSITTLGGKYWRYGFQQDIGNFLGDKYRHRVYDQRFIALWDAIDTPFLLRSVYGDKYGIKKKELNERYYNYKIVRGRKYYLPHPFNMGEDWYLLAFKKIAASVRCEKKGAVHKYQSLYAHKRMMAHYEEFYEDFEEWVVMMGI